MGGEKYATCCSGGGSGYGRWSLRPVVGRWRLVESTTYCRNCGHDLPADARFCSSCGQAKDTPTSHQEQSPAPESPASPPPQQSEGLSNLTKAVIVIIILVIVAAWLGSGNRDNASSSSNREDAAESASPASPQSASPASPTPPPPSEPEPINLSGFGQQATEPFNLETGLVIFRMTHQGDGHFSSTLLDSNGNRPGMDSLLANMVGPFDGSRATQAKSGQHVIDIAASGPWTITIEQPRPTSASQPTSFDGNSQAATDFFKLSRGLKTFYMTHQGSGHFGVHLLNKDGARVGMESLLANDVGPFDGSKAVRIPKEDIYLLQVEADGPWTIQVE
jgi:hypothetical protein